MRNRDKLAIGAVAVAGGDGGGEGLAPVSTLD